MYIKTTRWFITTRSCKIFLIQKKFSLLFIEFLFLKINDGTTQMIDSTNNETKPQIMTFDIPLNDTSSAGLGITLKGKTSIVDGQSIDLGIFVKSILTGGAASRVNFN